MYFILFEFYFPVNLHFGHQETPTFLYVLTFKPSSTKVAFVKGTFNAQIRL